MRLEDRVTRGGVCYISSIERAGSDLILKFLGDPERPAIVRTLTFSGVQDYREEWYDRDDECIDMLIGLLEDPKGVGVDYMLHTDQRDIWFHTEAEPKVEDMSPTAA